MIVEWVYTWHELWKSFCFRSCQTLCIHRCCIEYTRTSNEVRNTFQHGLHLLTNTLMTLPIFIIKPKAITEAAVPSSGYIENCSSITVSCSIVVTHLELCRTWKKIEKSIFAPGRFLCFVIQCINLFSCLFGRHPDY